MEIITYVLDGELAHKDSMGNGSVIRPGEVQRMSAGTGVRHSEMNPSPAQWLHLLQIWILPARNGMTPSYEQKMFDKNERQGRLRLVASPDGADGSVTIHQDVRLYASLLDGEEVTHTFANGRYGWLHVARGNAIVNGIEMKAGDGAAIEDEASLTITGDGAEVLLFDLN
jgi:redox-sensitive bicupin YhaK (pirin superfamily)